MRIIDVTHGAEEYLTAQVVSNDGNSLRDATFEVALGSGNTPPGTWVAAQNVRYTSDTVVLVSLMVNDVSQIGDKQHLWVRIADAPEWSPRRASNEVVAVR